MSFYRRVMLLCTASVFGVLSGGCTINNCDEGSICTTDESSSAECSALCQRLVDCGRIDRGGRAQCMDACEEALRQDEEVVEEYCECVPETSCRDLNRECGRPPFTLPPANGDQDGDVDDPPPPARDAGAGRDAAPDDDAAWDAGPALDAAADAHVSVDGHVSVDAHVSIDAQVDAGSDAGSAPDAAPDARPSADSGAGACTCDEDCAASEGCVSGVCRARCTASCECRRGDVCESGYCVTPPPASMSCENDCDCPAGGHCVNAVCVGPAPLL